MPRTMMAIKITKDTYPIAAACLGAPKFKIIPEEEIYNHYLIINMPGAPYPYSNTLLQYSNTWVDKEMFDASYFFVEGELEDQFAEIAFKAQEKDLGKSIGMAIKITGDNRQKLSILNRGLTPKSRDVGKYLFFPYDYDSAPVILLKEEFFKAYRFANDEDKTILVDVDKR